MRKLAPGDGALIDLSCSHVFHMISRCCWTSAWGGERLIDVSTQYQQKKKKKRLRYSPCCLVYVHVWRVRLYCFRFLNVPGAVAISGGLMDLRAGVMTKKDNWHGEEFKWTDTNLFTKAGSILRLWIMKSRRTCLLNSISPTRPERWAEAASALLWDLKTPLISFFAGE